MNSETVRKYIDLHGNFNVFRSDGQILTLSVHLISLTNFDVLERIYTCDINFQCEPTGIDVERGEHQYAGFYEYPFDVLESMQAIELADEYARELRHLLPATEAMVNHYSHHTTGIGPHTVNVRVYGLISTDLRQSQKSTIVVCPINGTGPTNCGHRIQGYMYNFHDCTVKFDSIQAWRMRELTAEELLDYDARWGNLIKYY